MNGKSQKEKLYPTKKTFCKIYSQFIIPSPFSFPNSWNTNYRRSSFKHGILALNSEEIPSIMKKKPGIFCTFQYSKHQFSSGGNKGKSSFAFPEIPFKSQLVPVNSFPGEKSFFQRSSPGPGAQIPSKNSSRFSPGATSGHTWEGEVQTELKSNSASFPNPKCLEKFGIFITNQGFISQSQNSIRNSKNIPER